MGAINFIGGSWTGGGDGKLFNDYEAHYYKDYCAQFSEDKKPTEENYWDYLSDWQNEDYENVTYNLDVTFENVLSLIGDKKYLLRPHEYLTWKKYFSLSQIANALGHADLLEVKSGYYSGFQVIANKDRWGDDLINSCENLFPDDYPNNASYNTEYLPEDIQEQIYKDINTCLSNIETRYFFGEKIKTEKETKVTAKGN